MSHPPTTNRGADDEPMAPSEPASEPDIDPEKTTQLAQTPQAQGPQHSLASWDPERTNVVTRIPPNLMPPPVFTSGHVPYGATGSAPTPARSAAPSNPPSYAPPPMFSAQYAPPPPKNRRRLVLAVVAACVVLAVVLVVVIVASSRGDGGFSGGGASTPQDAAKGYLEALAHGDAAAALAYGQSVPGSKDLLTADVLARQLEAAPITDVKVLDDGSPVGDDARVHVSAKFGSQVSDTKLTMRRANGTWKLVDAVVKLDFSDYQRRNPAVKNLTVFGKSTSAPVYVFPGWVDYGSSNANLVLEADEPLLDQLETFLQFASVRVNLSPHGQDAVNSALSDDLAKCTASNRLAPPGCPLKVDPTAFVDGTAHWGALNDLTRIVQTFDPHTMTVAIKGTVETTFTAQIPTGSPSTGKLTGIISGTADVSTDPPTITYR
jgi:hypothetical protein